LRGGEIGGIVILFFNHPSREGRVNPEPRTKGGATAVPRANLLTSTVAIKSLGWGFRRVDDVEVEKRMRLQKVRTLLD
jgi:hypothetical protein